MYCLSLACGAHNFLVRLPSSPILGSSVQLLVKALLLLADRNYFMVGIWGT